MDILIVDHQDSFTFNLVHDLGGLVGVRPRVVDSHEVSRADVGLTGGPMPDLVVFSAGPGHPADARAAGASRDLLPGLLGRVPVFGLCFGQQLIVTALGGRVIEAPEVIHGQSDPVRHDGRGLFAGLPSPVAMMRYNSLVADPAALPPALECTATSERGEIMAVRHRTWPVWGVQFHPESVGSPRGIQLLGNLIELVRGRPSPV